MNVLVFAASHRKESINRKLARCAAQSVVEAGGKVDFTEYGEFDSPLYDDEMFDAAAIPSPVQHFTGKLEMADAVIIASPEYNWSFPGSLKNLIDWASVKNPTPFAGKAVLLLSASPSLRGGAQGLVHLRTPLSALGAFVYPRLFTLSRAHSAFAVDGRLLDEKLRSELGQLARQFCAYAGAIRSL